jgi:hypothetical protein
MLTSLSTQSPRFSAGAARGSSPDSKVVLLKGDPHLRPYDYVLSTEMTSVHTLSLPVRRCLHGLASALLIGLFPFAENPFERLFEHPGLMYFTYLPVFYISCVVCDPVSYLFSYCQMHSVIRLQRDRPPRSPTAFYSTCLRLSDPYR